MDTYSIWLDFQSEVNTSQNGWFRPHTDFIRALNAISVELWNDYTGQAEKSQEIKDKLFPFLKTKNISVESSTAYYGQAKKPEEYGRFASCRVLLHDNEGTLPDKNVDEGKCEGFKTPEEIKDEYYDALKEFPVVMVDNQRWGSYSEHLTKGPTLTRPGITQVGEFFKVAPRKVSVIVMDYYVEPKEATLKYSLTPGNLQTGSGDSIQYDKNASTPLQWPEQMRREFLQKLKEWYIAYTRDPLFNSIALQQKASA